MNNRNRVGLFFLMILFVGWMGGCVTERPKEGVTLTVDTVLSLSDELLLEPKEGYGLYCLVVTVENLGDYETPFSGPDDISFLPENTVSVLYGGFERFGYKTQENIQPHGRAQIAVPFMTADPNTVTAIVYNTKQLDKTESVQIPVAMSEVLNTGKTAAGVGERHGDILEQPTATSSKPAE